MSKAKERKKTGRLSRLSNLLPWGHFAKENHKPADKKSLLWQVNQLKSAQSDGCKGDKRKPLGLPDVPNSCSELPDIPSWVSGLFTPFSTIYEGDGWNLLNKLNHTLGSPFLLPESSLHFKRLPTHPQSQKWLCLPGHGVWVSWQDFSCHQRESWPERHHLK